MAFYHVIMLSVFIIAVLVIAWTQLAGGKKYYGAQHNSSKIEAKLYKRMTLNCGSWRNSAQVYTYLEITLAVYSILSSFICIYIASGWADDKPAIILYSMLSALFSIALYVVRFKVSAIGYRKSFVEMKDGIMKHSTGLINDEELLDIHKRCEERITMSVIE